MSAPVMNNVINPTAVAKAWNVSHGPVTEFMAEKLEPVYTMKFGRGQMKMYHADQALALQGDFAAWYARRLAGLAAKKNGTAAPPEPRVRPNMAAGLLRIEAKLDQLIEMWRTK